MDELVRWLGEQLDDDERIALAATDGPWTPWRGAALHGLGDLLHPVLTPGQKPGAKAVIATASWLDAEHIAAHDPARVLREIEAKRQIIAPYAAALAERATVRARMREVIYKEPDEFARLHRQESRLIESAVALAPVVALLALPYSDRPGYAEALAAAG